MYLIVGLGNPGEENAHTRHNAGFDAVDAIAGEVGARYWKTECGSLTAKGAYRDVDLVLAKPQSYMNTSGGPVKQLMNAYGVDAEHLIVIHDELDIDPGTVRVKFGGGHAGHNGLRSICDKLGTRDWSRVRVGIGRPPGAVAAQEGGCRRLHLRRGPRRPGRALAGSGGPGEDPAGVQLGKRRSGGAGVGSVWQGLCPCRHPYGLPPCWAARAEPLPCGDGGRA